MAGPSRGRPPRRPLSVRGAAPAKRRRGGNSRVRLAVGRVLLVGALVLAGAKLVQVQGFQAEALSEQAEKQRATFIDIPAARGSITDRNGKQLAFSVEARALYAVPQMSREKWDEAKTTKPGMGSYEDWAREVARFIQDTLGPGFGGQKTDERTLYELLTKDTTYVELVDNVDPGKAATITDKYSDIGSEYRAVRVYPNGDLASNIVGAANWRKDQDPPATHGLLGLENSQDNLLAGRNGRRVVDTMQGSNVAIPGPDRSRELAAATPGRSLELTLDVDTQFAVQRLVTEYTAKSGAKNGSAVVMDVRNGDVLAMANDKTFDPADFGRATEEQTRNTAVTAVFEPGSVNKVVTAATALEDGIYQPDSVLTVDDEIKVADRVIRDASPHPVQDMSFAGVFAMSSNVGTLMTAQKIGEDRYAEMLRKFGLGKRTGSGLPGEEAGTVPPRNQWSGSTFGNLPIGQGLSMTLLQMTGMYQAIANDGVRVQPRVIRAEVDQDGVREEAPRGEESRVVSPQTAKSVRDMFRAVVQKAPGQTGTGASAALPGYQVSGKTGTAQQVDRSCGCYSVTTHWITFAGIFPADNPRYVVGIMLDAPTGGGRYSESAAPLFHDIASYLAQRYQVPMSAEQSPIVPLIL
ncbi:peptidoglycan D,D-transpeptidase FtsI family protein [Saccharothrix algeriensis]|uniref:Cell division protein FtsI (Penicillin-binding protein 3) n=1 Tax=Saccharothrix algeriensis TaxID=173560 RepID=A0A8T8HU29_9PSEU|nr:penicillin-binding protein 2 [Saccharothrix algeriensis]MBM7813543.1 cell division protein FtsI (penicillin-binding protein 3) [Saccharothrix algeriensis]QTR02045.1 penicillin-binding protein 2 [Saccharothrix algeriensis]